MIPYSIVGSYMVSLTWLKFVSFASEPRLHFLTSICCFLWPPRGHGGAQAGIKPGVYYIVNNNKFMKHLGTPPLPPLVNTQGIVSRLQGTPPLAP